MNLNKAFGMAVWFGLSAMAGMAPAASLYWDPDRVQDGGPNGADGGAGSWGASSNQWWDGTAYVSGGTADTFVFDGTGGAVAVPGTASWKQVGSLRWSVNGYSLTNTSGYMGNVGSLIVDPFVTATLGHRVLGNPTVSGGGLLIYTNSGANYLGAGGGAVSVSGSGTVVYVQGGGLATSGSNVGGTIGANATLKAGMDDAVMNGSGTAGLTVNGLWDLNGFSNGSFGAYSPAGLKCLTLNSNGQILTRGGSFIVQSQNSDSAGYGFFVMTGGTIDTRRNDGTGGGNMGLLAGHLDSTFPLTISGGSINTGTGKLILGGAGTNEHPNGISLALSGGASISGRIDLSNLYSASARTRTFAVNTGGFTIAADLANGSIAGCGLRKTGAGLLTLNGTNTFTGPLTNSAGTVRLNGRTLGRIVVNGGATLDGTGILAVTNGPLQLDSGSTLDLSMGLSFDVSGMTAPVTVATNLGGTLIGFANHRVTAGWYLYTNDTQIVAATAVPPTLASHPAAALTDTSADLIGEVLAIGTELPQVWVYWGTNNGGTDVSAWQTNASLGLRDAGLFTNSISDLKTGTLYYYRFLGVNVGGTNWSALQSCVTTGGTGSAPVIENLPAANIGFRGADLVGQLLSPGSSAPEMSVYWGTNDGVFVKGDWATNVSLGTSGAGALTNSVTGLQPETTYYYRFYGTNVAGEAWGETVSFHDLPRPARRHQPSGGQHRPDQRRSGRCSAGHRRADARRLGLLGHE